MKLSSFGSERRALALLSWQDDFQETVEPHEEATQGFPVTLKFCPFTANQCFDGGSGAIIIETYSGHVLRLEKKNK